MVAETRSLMKQVVSQLSGSGSGISVVTDSDYEIYARKSLPAILLERCGLEVIRGADGNRSSFIGLEWDYRVPVLVSQLPPNSKSERGVFETFTFPKKLCYIPPAVVKPRTVTPTRIGASPHPPAAHYLAIVEISTSRKWTKSTSREGLLQRLEQRLAKSLDRAYSLNYIEKMCITDLVAVVGIVSPEEYTASVCDLMSHSDAPPLLKEMMDAGRFVFIQVPKAAGSVSASPLLPSPPVERRVTADPSIWTPIT